MTEIQKTNSIIATFFGVYQVLVLWFLNPFDFLVNPLNFTGYLLLFLLNGSITYLLLFIASRKESQFLKLVTFLLSVLFSALIIWLIYQGKNEKFVLYLSAFILSSLLPTCLNLLWQFMQKIQIKVIQSDESNETNKNQFFELNSPNGKNRLKIAVDKLICFEANDNYVNIYYLADENNVQKSMERLSLKQISESMLQIDMPFERIHKSYLINPAFCKGISGKAQGYKVQMLGLETELPVSRNYEIDRLKG